MTEPRKTIVNGVEITPETVYATREFFAQLSLDCIADAQSGATPVNDLDGYIAWRERCISDSLSGSGDHTLAFLQRAFFIQTGECPPLLSR